MERIKNILFFIALPLVLATSLFITSAAGVSASAKAKDWYFKPNEEHRQPEVADLMGRKVIYCGDSAQKKIAITFDAGYDKGTHAPILDTLKQKKVSATFFLDGNFLKSNQAIVRRMAAEGHSIGNHTLHHADMTKLTDFSLYQAEVEGWNEILQGYGLEPSGYFRFPAGRYSERALEYNEKLGLQTVFWSFAYYDWVEEDQPTPDAAIEKIISRMHNGCVLLLHSTSHTNSVILGELIDRLRAEGYEIVSLDELTNSTTS
jgi:peptidoglycan-N-acetylmuramic acid deacetylase